MTDQRKIERRKAFDLAAPKPLMREAENRRKPEGLVMSKTHFADDETLKYIAELETKLAAAEQRAEAMARDAAESHCVWMQDSDGPWNTSCGHVFEFTEGGPYQNNAEWCQYCGGKLLPQYHDAEQESAELDAATDAAIATVKSAETRVMTTDGKEG